MLVRLLLVSKPLTYPINTDQISDCLIFTESSQNIKGRLVSLTKGRGSVRTQLFDDRKAHHRNIKHLRGTVRESNSMITSPPQPLSIAEKYTVADPHHFLAPMLVCVFHNRAVNPFFIGFGFLIPIGLL